MYVLLVHRFDKSIGVAETEQTTLCCWLESGDNGVDVLFPNIENNLTSIKTIFTYNVISNYL